MKPATFKELQEYKVDQQIPCVEGVLVTIYDPKTGIAKGGANKGKEWTLQSCNLRDDNSDEHRLLITSADQVLDKRMKGKRIRISSHVGSKGMSGVYMSENTYTNKNDEQVTERQIKITATALVEELGAGGEAKSDKPSSNGAPASRPAAHHSQPDYELTPVSQRAGLYFDVMEEVKRQVDIRTSDKDSPLHKEEFSVEDYRAITAVIAGTYRADKGAYAPPYFGPASGTSEKELAAMPGKEWEGDKGKPQATEKPQTWREYVYKDVKLGDKSRPEMRELLKWYHLKGKATESEVGKKLAAQLLMAGAELKMPDLKAVAYDALGEHGLGKEFMEEDVEGIYDLDDDDVASEIITNPEAAAKKATKAHAKAKPAASDDSDLPA